MPYVLRAELTFKKKLITKIVFKLVDKADINE